MAIVVMVNMLKMDDTECGKVTITAIIVGTLVVCKMS